MKKQHFNKKSLTRLVIDLLVVGGGAAISVGASFVWSWPIGAMVGGSIALLAGVSFILAGAY